MQTAEDEARDMGNNYIGSEHLLLAFMKHSDTPLSKYLTNQDLCYNQLKEDLMILFGLKDQKVEEIQITQIVDDILERATKKAKQDQCKQIDIKHLTAALLQTKSCVATEILHRYDIDEDLIMMYLEHGTKHSELDKIAELRNLNTCGLNQDIVGRDEELNFMISILSRKDKANPLLIGEPGVGKTALVEKLAGLVEQKKIPSLQGSCIYELHLNTLVAGTKYRGDFEEKLQNIIRLLEKYPHIILFIDEIHQMIGAGKSEGSIDVSSVLKPYLARGSIRCIGATTVEEYEKYIEKDRALERRFQVIMIKEPKKAETLHMLQAKLVEYETYHNVIIDPMILKHIVDYCDYFMPARKFPDKAIDVLDLACVCAKQHETHTVSELMVCDVIQKLTDIPIANHSRLQDLQQHLQRTIIGQDEVIHKLMMQLEWIDQGVIMERPLGVWLFLGNSGVGKKTLIQQFNRLYFNQDDFVEFDMASFDHNFEHNLSRLRRNPYTIVSIVNLHMAKESLLQYLKQSIERGYLEHNMYKVDLRHCIIIMSGSFLIDQTTSLSFQQEQDPYKKIRQQLGTSFLQIFDEIFTFQDLTLNHKVDIVKHMLKKWNKTMAETAILDAIEQTTTLEEVTKVIKKKIVKA